MDNHRVEKEFALIKNQYPQAALHSSSWIRIPNWIVPEILWNMSAVTICTSFPANYPGQAPYGFYVSPENFRHRNGTIPSNSQIAADTPFGGNWLKFSWQVDPWFPAENIHNGSNMLNFIDSIRQRLNEGN